MHLRTALLLLLPAQLVLAATSKIPVGKLLDQMVQRSTLAEPGAHPFHMKATLTDTKDAKSEFNGTVEELWVSPKKWRRTIKLRDFSQTRIVNGDLVFEENIGDYFPLYDEMLANEIVDPLPQSAIDLFKKLEMEDTTAPGLSEGQCMAEKYYDDTDGKEQRVLLAYDCKTGLQIYLWSPSCCYGVLTDYHKFHDKQIAFATKDDPISIRIDSLKDLDQPDEKLFTVTQPTPAIQRITTTQMSEGEARKLLIEEVAIQWPQVTKKPNGTGVEVNLVIGRDGRVKEEWSYFSDDAIKKAVLSAVQQWKFSPQTIDGVPTQIHTKLTIPFSSQLQNEAPATADVRPIFDRMRAAQNLRLEGAPSFHLKANFQSEDNTAKGIYEETWVAPKKWRREVTLNGNHIVEVRTEDAFYRTFPGQYAPRLADDVIDVLSFGLPGDNGADYHAPDWTALNTTLVNLPVLRLSNGYINPQGRPDPLTALYFIEEKTGFIRGRHHYSNLAVFNDLRAFGNKTVARKVTLFGSDVSRLEIVIDTLEPAPLASESLLQMPGVKPIFTSADEAQRFTEPRVIHTVRPSLSGWRGKATCSVSVDEHGHVRDVEVKGTNDDSVIKQIRAAIMNWEFEPATTNGHPSLGLAHVGVQ